MSEVHESALNSGEQKLTSISKDSINGQYSCNICQKTFRNKRSQSNHVYNVHSGRIYACQHCSKQFQTRTGRTKHVDITHLGRRYVCDICNMQYLSNDTKCHHQSTTGHTSFTLVYIHKQWAKSRCELK